MSQFTFTNKGFRGFTLIELLVVISIIGLLGTIISGPILSARNKAKDAKKVADVKNIQSALEQYVDATGNYPTSLGLLVPNYLEALPRNALNVYTPQIDKYMYTYYNCANNAGICAYHLWVKLSVTGSTSLDNDADCGGLSCLANGNTISSTVVTNFTNTNDPGAVADAATDLAVIADTSLTACTGSLTVCIYDVRGNR